MTTDTSMSSRIVLPNEKPKNGYWPHSRMIIGKYKDREAVAVGIDPGVHYGITIINSGVIRVLWGILPRQTERGYHGIDAFKMASNFFDTGEWYNVPAVVEGAAFRAKYGQVGLEEVRFGFFFGLFESCLDVHILPPATVRLHAFGNGKQQAMDIWPAINHNGADSIGMALCALEKTWTTEK